MRPFRHDGCIMEGNKRLHWIAGPSVHNPRHKFCLSTPVISKVIFKVIYCAMAVKYVLTSKSKSQTVCTFCIEIFMRNTMKKKSLKNVHSVLRYREFLSKHILSSRGQGHLSRSTKSNLCTAPYRYSITCKEFVSIDIAIFD